MPGKFGSGRVYSTGRVKIFVPTENTRRAGLVAGKNGMWIYQSALRYNPRHLPVVINKGNDMTSFFFSARDKGNQCVYTAEQEKLQKIKAIKNNNSNNRRNKPSLPKIVLRELPDDDN